MADNAQTPEAEGQEPVKPRVSALIVSHNRADLLRRCLTSLEASQDRERIEVIVVDNGSTDGSAAMDAEFPNAQFIRIPRNFGLTKALNIGIRAAEADYILFLHEDTELPPEAAAQMADVLDGREDIAGVCPELVNGEPGFEPGGAPIEVNEASGAALMVKAFFLGAGRKIDEHYGQYGSALEIARQIRRAGKKLVRLPGLRVRHQPRGADSALLRADEAIGRAVWAGKQLGFAQGLKARLGAILSAIAGLRLREAGYLVSGQKVDGTQKP